MFSIGIFNCWYFPCEYRLWGQFLRYLYECPWQWSYRQKTLHRCTAWNDNKPEYDRSVVTCAEHIQKTIGTQEWVYVLKIVNFPARSMEIRFCHAESRLVTNNFAEVCLHRTHKALWAPSSTGIECWYHVLSVNHGVFERHIFRKHWKGSYLNLQWDCW